MKIECEAVVFSETTQPSPDGTPFIHAAHILVMICILIRILRRPIKKVIESRTQNKGGHPTFPVAIFVSSGTLLGRSGTV